MGNITKNNLPHFQYTVAEIRQLLSGIRWVVTTFNRRQTFDHMLQMQMNQTLIEVKQTIADIDRTMDDTLHTMPDLKQTQLFINGIFVNCN